MKANIRTYDINKLLNTKLRALHQRSKGRDLFDLDYSRLNHKLDTPKIIDCFYEYMSISVGKPPTKKEFLLNMEEKENDPDFIGDMEALLGPEIKYDQNTAFQWLKSELVEKLR